MTNRCETCGSPCERRWCSQSCNAASRRSGRDATCEHCKATFYLRGTYEAKGGGRFCSVACRRAFKAAHSENYLKHGKRAIHRIVAAEKLGRPLRPGEVVHHIDGNKLNNAPENLDVYDSQSAHISEEIRTGRVGFTHEQAVRAGVLSGAARRHRATSKSER